MCCRVCYCWTLLYCSCICFVFIFLLRLYCGSLVHGAVHELKRGIEADSFLAGAPVAIRLYWNLQAAVERELGDDLIIRMRTRTWPRECQTQVDGLSKAVERLMDEDEQEDEEQCMKDDKVLEETCSVRTRYKTKHRTPKSKSKKQERVGWQ